MGTRQPFMMDRNAPYRSPYKLFDGGGPGVAPGPIDDDVIADEQAAIGAEVAADDVPIDDPADDAPEADESGRDAQEAPKITFDGTPLPATSVTVTLQPGEHVVATEAELERQRAAVDVTLEGEASTAPLP